MKGKPFLGILAERRCLAQEGIIHIIINSGAMEFEAKTIGSLGRRDSFVLIFYYPTLA